MGDSPRSPADIAPAYANNLFKFGRSDSIGLIRRVIWDGVTGAYTGFLAAEAIVEILSDSADDGDGTAAIDVLITGQGDDGKEISELITLDATGVTPVLSTKKFKIIYRAHVFDTNDSNEISGPNHGNITVRESATPANIMAVIKPTFGQTLMCIYKIPSDKYGEFVNVRGYPASGKDTTISVFVRYNIGRGNAWTISGSVDIPSGGAPADIDLSDMPRFLTPGTEIIVMAKVSATTGIVSANFDIKLYDL